MVNDLLREINIKNEEENLIAMVNDMEDRYIKIHNKNRDLL